ncbi:MAG: hypothetical protein LBD73_03830 [Deferribacteraceae bacterium]|jgi:ComF family protein|nr:hypothetical protein [Deferribacteraceae bacterium]
MLMASVFQSLCAACGGVCDFNDILCESCSASIRKIDARCTNCGHPLNINAAFCGHCADQQIDHYYADYIFEGAARKMILEVKYAWRLRGVSQIGRLCGFFRVDFSLYDTACVVPSHFLRNFVRYVHPVSLIKKALAKNIKFENLLRRTRNTEFQSKLSRRERARNIKGVFETKGGLKGKKIILIDDIITTGSTLREAAKALKKAGADRVDVYALFARRPA